MGVNPKACAKLQVFSDIRASFHYFFCLMTISEKFFAKNLQVSNISRTFAPAIKQHSVGAIAQLVEQRTENPCVPGSIPGGTTYKRSYSLERLLFCIFTDIAHLVEQRTEKQARFISHPHLKQIH